MASDRQQFRWGIVGTGFIARKFALGLTAVRADATVAAVCSRSESSARAFCEPLGVPRRFTSYDEFVADDGIDAIYVATPGDTHFALARAALEAGRPVLVEKPFCLNAREAEALATVARSRAVFCMEAMWTRFLPLVRELRARVRGGEIGTPRYFSGTFALAEAQDADNHLLDPARGGGAILDRAVYPVSLASALLGSPDGVDAQVSEMADGRDAQAAVTLTYANGCIGQLFASMQTSMPNRFTIAGTQGVIDVRPPIYRPFEMSISPVAAGTRSRRPIGRRDFIKESGFVHRVFQRISALTGARHARTVRAYYQGNGYVHQALEVMRCVRSSQTESELMPLEESVSIMRTLDEIRTQAHVRADAPRRVAAISGAGN
jgi:predicted dehydrogenase